MIYLTVVGYLKVIRPPLMVLGGVASVGLYLWSHQVFDILGLLIFLTVFSGNLSWSLCNEYEDYKKGIDIQNKPEKPLPSGQVDPYKVHILSDVLLCISLVMGVLLGIFFGLIYLIALLGHTSSAVYNCIRKDLLGNVCMATTYGVGAFLSLYPHHLLFCLPFALFTLAHNLNNQFQDWKAEQTAGVVTVPQQLGSEKTYLLAWTLLSVTLVSFSHLYLKTGYLPLLIFLAVTVTTMISTCSMLMKPEKAHSIIENVARRLGRFLLLIGFLSMLVS